MASTASPEPPARLGGSRTHSRVRSVEAARKLADHERRIYLPLVLSAVLPIVVAASRAPPIRACSIVVNVITWLVFVYDLIVHMRYVRGYLRTGVGLFDLAVVILTAPWFLLPGASGSQILVLARLARLVRLFFVSPGARQAGRRLGGVGLFAVAMLLFGSWMAYVAEHPANPELRHLRGLPLVGHRDAHHRGVRRHRARRPGRAGRPAVFLMLTGIGTLGIISGTLASAFRRSAAEKAVADAASADAAPPMPPGTTCGPR